MHSSTYIETNTLDDVLSSLELAAEFHDRARSDRRFWKWFVIALHAGVQGTFALVLEQGNGLMVQKPNVTERTIAAIDTESELPDPHMDNFLRLYRKVRKMVNSSHSGVAKAGTTPEEDALSGLDELRDGFLHFNTKAWAIEKTLIDRRSRDSFAIARGLLLDSGLVRLHKPTDVARVQRAVFELSVRLGTTA